MQKKEDNLKWIPLWVEKWLWGSTRLELTVEQRAVWIDLLAIASKEQGHVRANEGFPYPPEQLAGMLRISPELLNETIRRCVETGKLRTEEDGSLYVINWEEYQFSDRYLRKLREYKKKTRHNITLHNTHTAKAEHSSGKAELADMGKTVLEIVSYFNSVTGQKRSASCEETRKLISGRLAEGRTLEDFKTVIDRKHAKWKDDPKMKDYIRPSTLFRPGNFEDYLNERPASVSARTGWAERTRCKDPGEEQ